MRMSATAVLILLACGSICVAQEASSSDQDGGNSVAAAAKASRSRVDSAKTKEADIRQLLEITGASGLAVQSMDEMEKTIRPMMTDALPAGEYRERLVELFFQKFHAKRDTNQLVDLIIPIYDKYYSDDEIKSLIQLYKSPLGKKMLTVLPKVMAESQAAGQAWGQQLGRECMIEVLTEHPELQTAMQQAKANPQSH